MPSPRFLFARRPNLERSWPFVPARLAERLRALGELVIHNSDAPEPLHQQIDLAEFEGLALFGGQFTEEGLASAPRLRAVGLVGDNSGHGLPVSALEARGIPIIDATRAWAPSVAECALALALDALRQIPRWHCRMTHGERLWEFPYAQFCDAPGFVNGELGARAVGVIGLGQIGRRIAQWCRALGSEVCGFDPYVPAAVVEEWGVRQVDMDTLVDASEVVFVAVPPTPSAKHLLSRERIARLRKGALVVVITRAHAVDMAALRERIVADEIAGAFDVYDVEPLPVDDPLRGRANVVHTPHIAGRTRDANLRVADLIAEDFARVIRGEPPLARLTREAIAVRTGQSEAPPAESLGA